MNAPLNQDLHAQNQLQVEIAETKKVSIISPSGFFNNSDVNLEHIEAEEEIFKDNNNNKNQGKITIDKAIPNSIQFQANNNSKCEIEKKNKQIVDPGKILEILNQEGSNEEKAQLLFGQFVNLQQPIPKFQNKN
eukprot:TRINITY_DN13913_c0_g1_i3.p5 TRINITY_DN13913_c0_g1~~TRINITY_DN13913_c0_g1_i3.p5  ORF type:complete len:134 (+),score=32.92 TRINITY_DN13913_c0_g1_i3:486-887(+)